MSHVCSEGCGHVCHMCVVRSVHVRRHVCREGCGHDMHDVCSEGCGHVCMYVTCTFTIRVCSPI